MLDDEHLRIINFFVLRSVHFSSYVAPVSTDTSGNVSGGGTSVLAFNLYSIGIGVENLCSRRLRFVMSLKEVTQDRYTSGTRKIWSDIDPGERQRLTVIENASAGKIRSLASQTRIEWVGYGSADSGALDKLDHVHKIDKTVQEVLPPRHYPELEGFGHGSRL